MPFTIHHLDVTTSTNDETMKHLRTGGDEGHVFWADRQTAGRGRLGRSWETTVRDVALSVALRPSLPPERYPLLTLVAGAAVFDFLRAEMPEADLSIKWPNDVYAGGRKIAGILCETHGAGVAHFGVVIGVGLDVNGREEDYPPELRGLTTSIHRLTGRTLDREKAVQNFLQCLEKRYLDFLKNGEGDVIDFCNRHAYLKNRAVVYESPEGSRLGTALDLDAQGHLRIRTDSGDVISVMAGDVTLASSEAITA